MIFILLGSVFVVLVVLFFRGGAGAPGCIVCGRPSPRDPYCSEECCDYAQDWH